MCQSVSRTGWDGEREREREQKRISFPLIATPQSIDGSVFSLCLTFQCVHMKSHGGLSISSAQTRSSPSYPASWCGQCSQWQWSVRTKLLCCVVCDVQAAKKLPHLSTLFAEQITHFVIIIFLYPKVDQHESSLYGLSFFNLAVFYFTIATSGFLFWLNEFFSIIISRVNLCQNT